MIFRENTAGLNGGAIKASANSALAVTNATFWGNTAGGAGGAIYKELGTEQVEVWNSILWENGANDGADEIAIDGSGDFGVCVRYSMVAGGEPDGASGWDNAESSGSIAINAGSPTPPNFATYGEPPADLDGNPRIVGSRIDIGAYEAQD